MPNRKIAFLRLCETHDGQNLIKTAGAAGRNKNAIEIKTTILNGDVPGFFVNYGAGLEKFYPASNVMHAELEHGATTEVLASAAEMEDMVKQLEATRVNIRKTTAADVKKLVARVRKATALATELYTPLPKDGQISRDRKKLSDATSRAVKLGMALEELIPKAEERPKG